MLGCGLLRAPRHAASTLDFLSQRMLFHTQNENKNDNKYNLQNSNSTTGSKLVVIYNISTNLNSKTNNSTTCSKLVVNYQLSTSTNVIR